MTQSDPASTRSDKWIFGSIVIFSLAGLISAFVLSVEKIHLLQQPDAVLSCSFNVWLNCASVMKTWQASLFGFPNSFIGLMAYPILVTLAVAKLLGANFSRIFFFLAQIGALLGLIFAYWLFFQSVYVIGVLCPWCLIVTFSTTMIFAALLRYNLRENNLYLPFKTHQNILRLLQKDYDKTVVLGWLTLLVAMILLQFRDFMI